MSLSKYDSATSKRTKKKSLATSGGRRAVNERVAYLSVDSLHLNPRNSRRHSREQIHKLAQTIKALGVFSPVLIDETRVILAGHGRLEAARSLGMTEVPTLEVTGLTPAEKRAFVVADNRLAELATWDRETLRAELADLVAVNFDVELTGFSTGEFDVLLDGAGGKETSADDAHVPIPGDSEVVSRPSDLWLLGPHRLLCADATARESFTTLLDGRKANLVFGDPPYNVPIGGHVSGLGKKRHREFEMASGEMSKGGFTRFLITVFGHLADFSSRGSIHFLCMDWRHLQEIMTAGHEIYSDLKNLCVWSKTNAGMGSLYRSQHELILVFQNGAGRFTNNVNLGATGRYRTNVWVYPGMTSMGKGRMDELEMHPTVKPIALIADAIRDCSRRNELVLDPFVGSGTTILAAHRTGRVAAAMEIDPAYVDVAIQRWERATGVQAVLAASGESFAVVRGTRLGSHKPASKK